MTAKTKAKAKRISKPKTRAQWAKEICANYKQSVESARALVDGILKTGRSLIAAKKALDHNGEWLPLIERDLPFSESMAQQYMALARDPRIANAQRVRLLPATIGTLFDLSRLSDTDFKRGLESGAINPAMKRTDVRTIKVHETHRTERLGVAPHVASTLKVTHSPPIIAEPNYNSQSSQIQGDDDVAVPGISGAERSRVFIEV